MARQCRGFLIIYKQISTLPAVTKQYNNYTVNDFPDKSSHDTLFFKTNVNVT